jgi:hypothetical protein
MHPSQSPESSLQPSQKQKVKSSWMPSTEALLLTSIVLALVVISRGDPGMFFAIGTATVAALYMDRIDRILKLPKPLKLLLLSAVAVVGGLFLSTVYSPAYALFFDGYEKFLNNTLGGFLPGGTAIFGVSVNIGRFIFVTYMIVKSVKSWNDRTNDEDWISLMKFPAIVGFTLLILDFCLQLIIA